MRVVLSRKLAVSIAAILLTLGAGSAYAQPDVGQSITKSGSPMVGIPTQGSTGITESVATIMARQAATPPDAEAGPKVKFEGELEIDRLVNPKSPSVAYWPPRPNTYQPLVLRPLAPQSVSTTFTGAVFGLDSNNVPPDTNGAIGPTQFIVAVNGRIRSFSRAGVADGALNVTSDVFFTTVRNASGASDPQVRFDRITQRWFITCINTSTPNRVLVAVSSVSTITSAANFTFFFFQQETVLPAGNATCLFDYPTTGIDANALYIGGNMFCPSYDSSAAFVVQKTSILGAGPIVVSAFRNLTQTPFASGPYTPRGVDNDDPGATEGYFVASDIGAYGLVVLKRVSNPGGVPTMSPDIVLTVPLTNGPFAVEHLGNVHPGGAFNGKLDTSDDRFMPSKIRDGILWASQAVSVDSTGASQAAVGDRNAVRWYQIGSLSTTPTLIQSGTIYDGAASNPLSYTYGSMVPTGQGHVAAGMTAVGNLSYADAAQTGRLAGDPIGFMNTPQKYTFTNVPYNAFDLGTTRPERWGDYTITTLDPTDDQTAWTIQEYSDSPGAWGVKIARLLAPPPAKAASASPGVLAQGAAGVNVTITGTTLAGSGFFDPPASSLALGGYNRIAGSVSGGGVTVNTITYTDPTHVTLNLSVTAVAAIGARNVTITNPDGQSTTGNGVLAITGVGCSGTTFIAPASLPGGFVGDVYNQALSVSSGTAGPYTFSLIGGALPTGVTLGGSALTGSLTTAGVYSFTLQAVSGSCTVTASYTVTAEQYTITAVGGTPQGTPINTVYPVSLKAQVKNLANNPVPGVSVTFAAPGSGASGTFTGSPTVVTDAGGVATAPTFTANGTGGPFTVTAATLHAPVSASFNLYNLLPSTIVLNANDSGVGSLREAVLGVAPGGTVTYDPVFFSSPQTITLTTGQIAIAKNITITGPGARNVTVSGNNASRIFNVSGGPTFLTDMTLANALGNGAVANGGAIANSSTLTMTRLTVKNSVVSSPGTGPGLYNTGTATVDSCTFTGNSAATRGAIQAQSGTMTIVNSTITGNSASASGAGGGIRTLGAGGTTIINSTIFGNTAGTGANIASGALTNLKNTIVGGGSPGNDMFGTITSQDYNLFQNITGATIVGTTTNNINGVSPNLGALANNGGPTDTRLPNGASPALNVIPVASMTVTVDQRNVPRPNPGNATIGSVEGSVTCTPPTPTASNDGPKCAGSTLTLSTPTVAGATAYSWTGPNGFTSLSQNPAISSVTTAATGTYFVTITVGGCTSAAGSTTATVTVCAPTVSSIVRPCASTTGGLSVTITGNNFQPSATVTLVGTPAAVTSLSLTSITATAGARAAAPAVTGDVVVTNPDTQFGTLVGGFTYGLRGDANNNGALSPADAGYLNNFFAGTGASPAFPCIGGDANSSGALSPADAGYLNNFFAGTGAAPGP